MRASHSVWREGAVAGLLGAGTVALWFLVRDTLAGVPLRTASVLGEVLLFLNPSPDLERASAGAAAAYGVVHVVAFLLVGWLFALLARWATQEPVARFAVVVACLGGAIACWQDVSERHLECPVPSRRQGA